MNKIKLSIVDDHEIVRAGLRNFLSIHSDIDILGDFSNGEELLKSPKLKSNHILILDIKTPGLNGGEICSIVKKQFPRIKIIYLTSYTSSLPEIIGTSYEALILKDISPKNLYEIIKKVFIGKKVIDNELKELIKEYREIPELTERERALLRLLVKGYNNKKISKELFISLSTVKYHLSNIFMRLGVTTRAEAIAYSYKKNLI